MQIFDSTGGCAPNPCVVQGSIYLLLPTLSLGRRMPASRSSKIISHCPWCILAHPWTSCYDKQDHLYLLELEKWITFFKLHGLNCTGRNQDTVTRMDYVECRETSFLLPPSFSSPALALNVGAASHRLVSITLPVPILSSICESLALASRVLGSVSFTLASQAVLYKCSQNCLFSEASFHRGSVSGHLFLCGCPLYLLAPGTKGHAHITLFFLGSCWQPSSFHLCQGLQPARPHTGHPDGQVSGPDWSHAAALGPLSRLFCRSEIYFLGVLGQEKTCFLEVCQEGGNPPRKQTRPFFL